MADFPALGQLIGTTEEAFDDMVVDRATDGTGYARAFFTAEKARFVVRILLTETQRDTLKTFYTDNRLTPFNFTFEGDDVTYPNMLFEQRPKFTYIGAGKIQAEVRIVAK